VLAQRKIARLNENPELGIRKPEADAQLQSIDRALQPSSANHFVRVSQFDPTLANHRSNNSQEAPSQLSKSAPLIPIYSSKQNWLSSKQESQSEAAE
jgi:hypothetical protein